MNKGHSLANIRRVLGGFAGIDRFCESAQSAFCSRSPGGSGGWSHPVEDRRGDL